MRTDRRYYFGAGVTLALLFLITSVYAAGPCAEDLASCPTRGCAPGGSPDALVNEMKRRLPSNGTAIRLTFNDLAALQDEADKLVEQKHDLDAAQRALLRNLKTKSGVRVSEGDFVEIIGFVTGLPHRPKPSGPESVNCRLSGPPNNDIHIPIGAEQDDTEFEGVVVEMIPQGRHERWTAPRLRKIAKDGRPVAVRGQLFYDNKHRVNDDPDDVKASEPKRFTLWEIHPVTEFWVCVTSNKKCNTAKIAAPEWARLESEKVK